MSNLLSSPTLLMLIGVVVMAVAVIILAVWIARTSSRLNSANTQIEMLDKRLAHIETYLSRASRHDMVVEEEGARDEVAPKRQRASRTSRASEDAEVKSPRRSKREPVIPYGTPKASADDVYGGVNSPIARETSGPIERTARPSVTRDARRRREERHQEQIRRQAQNVLREHRRQTEGAADASLTTGQ